MVIDLVGAVLNGILSGLAVFLFASGLALVFGILRILNFSHGGFFMIGAYLALTMTLWTGAEGSLPLFVLITLVAAVLVAAMGIVVERLVFRRIRHVDEAFSLIATYALLLLCEGAVKAVWGVGYHSVFPPQGVDGALFFGDIILPSYSLFIGVVAIVVFVLLEWTVHRTQLGRLVQSVAADSWMSGVLGVNVPRFYAAVVVLSFFLGGLAGAILLPNQSLSPALANVFVIQAFGALIVGGMGNIRGAFLASILLAVIDSVGTTLVPGYPGIFLYVALAAILLIRPEGLIRGGTL